jgi:hypothetical protein
MGLHLCYELALPAETSRENVLEVLGRLRSRSERIGFDRIIAGFAGRLADTLEPEGHGTESPIFDHPEFEHLEGEGRP